MINFSTLGNSLFDWVSSIMPGSVKVIWADENRPQPDKTYLTLRFDSILRVGDDYEGRPDAVGDNVVTGNREFTLMIQAIGPGALGYLEDLRTSLQRFNILETLRLNGIVFIRANPIANITGLEDTQYFERGSFDIFFRIASVVTDVPSYVQKTEVEATYKKDDTVVFNDTLNINT